MIKTGAVIGAAAAAAVNAGGELGDVFTGGEPGFFRYLQIGRGRAFINELPPRACGIVAARAVGCE